MTDKKKYVPGKYEQLLMDILRNKLEQDSFIGNMLALTAKQEDPEANCKELYEFLQANPKASYDEIMEKIDAILGIYFNEDES